MAEILQALIQNDQNSLLVLFVALLVCNAAILWLVIRRLLQPLRKLNESIQAFGQGSWEKRVSIDRRDVAGQLARSFNAMADALFKQFHSLEVKAKTAGEQVETANELAQIASSSSHLSEFFYQTASLLLKRYGYPYASFYLVEKTHGDALDPAKSDRHLVLYQASGPPEVVRKFHGNKIAIDSLSLIGWVAAFNQPRVSLIIKDADLYPAPREDLLPETRVEAAIPIALRDRVLAVLNVQATHLPGFTHEEVTHLNNLARQLAPAIHAFQLLEMKQVNLDEINILLQASQQIAGADSAEQVLQNLQQVTKRIPYITALLPVTPSGLLVIPGNLPLNNSVTSLPTTLSIPGRDLEALFATENPILISDFEHAGRLPKGLVDLVSQLGCESAAILAVKEKEHLKALLLLGAKPNDGQANPSFVSGSLPLYLSLVKTAGVTLDKISRLEETGQRLAELHSVDVLSQAISVETDLASLYKVFHQQVNQMMGEVNFLIALYDAETNLISIPYMSEGAELHSIPPYPLGEGLTSILIQTGKPLFLEEDTENQLRQLGAKLVGAPARSWLGVPLLIGGDVIGAIVVQDTEKEHRFTQADQRALTRIAAQAAIVVRNTRLLEDARRKAERERLIAALSTQVWTTSDIDTILQRSLQELGESFSVSEGVIQLSLEDGLV